MAEQVQHTLCPKCGEKIRSGLKFCPQCGLRFVSQVVMVCPGCGKEAPKGEKFCSDCGQAYVAKSEEEA